MHHSVVQFLLLAMHVLLYNALLHLSQLVNEDNVRKYTKRNKKFYFSKPLFHYALTPIELLTVSFHQFLLTGHCFIQLRMLMNLYTKA